MIELTVESHGEREVVARLQGMTDVIRERLREALQTGGTELASAAIARAPASHGERSKASRRFGPLRSRIKGKLTEHGDVLFEQVGPTTAFYGGFQETGLDVMRKPARRRGVIGVRTRVTKTGVVLVSPKRGLMRRGSGESHPFRLPAHPFMRPAFDSLQGRIVERIQAAVASAIAVGG